jgi:hypothetical protein
MKKYQIIRIKTGEQISKHKNIKLANKRLRKIDRVRSSLYATRAAWLQGREGALQGYNFKVMPL